MSDEKKFVNYSPVGELKFPRLNKPDAFRGSSAYKTVVLLDAEDAEVIEFVEKLELHVFKDLKKGDYRPLKLVDGVYELTVKRKESLGKPLFFEPTGDRSSEMLERAPGLIWGGTRASVSFTAWPYDGGVTFGLIGVSIHELVVPPKKKGGKETTGGVDFES